MSKRAYVTKFFLVAGMTVFVTLLVYLYKNQHHSPLINTWKLVSTTNKEFGSNPTGYLIYSEKGVVSVQIAANSQEYSIIPYYAYVGYFDIDSEHKIVNHHLQISNLPEDVGRQFKRQYHIEDDILYLTTLDSEKKNIFTWKKVTR